MKLSGDGSLAGAFAELPLLYRKVLQLYKIQQSATGWVDPSKSAPLVAAIKRLRRERCAIRCASESIEDASPGQT